MALAGELGVENVVRHLQMRGRRAHRSGRSGRARGSARGARALAPSRPRHRDGDVVPQSRRDGRPVREICTRPSSSLDASLDFSHAARADAPRDVDEERAALPPVRARPVGRAPPGGRRDPPLGPEPREARQIEVWVLRLSAPVLAQRGDFDEAERARGDLPPARARDRRSADARSVARRGSARVRADRQAR